MSRATTLPPAPGGHYPAGPFVALALFLLLGARFLCGCAELLPALTAAAPVAAAGIDAYGRTLEAARAKGATDDELAEIKATLARIEALAREHNAACKAAEAPPADPGELARAMKEKAVLGEQLAIERAKVATLLEALDQRGRTAMPPLQPDAGATP